MGSSEESLNGLISFIERFTPNLWHLSLRNFQDYLLNLKGSTDLNDSRLAIVLNGLGHFPSLQGLDLAGNLFVLES